MYNPYADINLGHVLNPFQWAEIFGLLSFCVTDRFHGTVFCIKNEIPFISLENENIPRDQSKLFDLLTDFNLDSCYEHIDENKNSTSRLISHINEIEGNWEKSLRPSIKPTLLDMQERFRQFSDQMGVLLGWE
jgi:polysaccharide pyruvyl transferase WcaK-like protein